MKKLLSIKTGVPPSIWFEVHPQLGVAPMDYLYAKLDAMYPGRWSANFSTEMAIQNWKETWAQAFEKKKMTYNHIKNGLEQCLDLNKWPPSLPEFLTACNTVIPLMHRNLPPMLTGKGTSEGRKNGLKMLRECAKNCLTR